MKKLIAILVVLSILLLSACSSTQENQATSKTQELPANANDQVPSILVEDNVFQEEINQELIDPSKEIAIGEMI